MSAQQLKENLRGVVVPLVSPFNKDDSLDVDAFKEQVRFVVEGGIVNGKGALIVSGGGGELPLLTYDERVQLVRAAAEVAKGKVPLLAGVQDNGTKLCIDLAKRFEEAGADGLQLGPPYYYQDHSEDDLLNFYEAVGRAINIGIVVYNTWWHAPNMSSAFVARLAEVPNVVGVKWSSPHTSEWMRGFRMWANRLRVIDNQVLHIQSHIMGASGFITGNGSFLPRYEVQLWETLERCDYGKAKEMLALEWELYDFRGKVASRTGGEASVSKAALDLIGLRGGPPRPPQQPCNEDERKELREILTRHGIKLS